MLGYHTALEFHGKAHSIYSSLHYVSENRSLPLRFRSYEFRSVPVPHSLRKKGKGMFGVSTHTRSGVELRVTNFERTLVDIQDRPELTGSWEEIWRFLESIEFFEIDPIVEYALLLENATTAAKVGFFLDQHREALMVDHSHLEQLQTPVPRRAS